MKLTCRYIFYVELYSGVALFSLIFRVRVRVYVDTVDDMWEVFKNELLNRIDTFIPKIKSFQQIKKDS